MKNVPRLDPLPVRRLGLPVRRLQIAELESKRQKTDDWESTLQKMVALQERALDDIADLRRAVARLERQLADSKDTQ